MRRSTFFLLYTAVGAAVLLGFLLVHADLSSQSREISLSEKKRLVKELRITDLCLFTEARYTRHLSQADLHSAFQDHPMALDHFPSGSAAGPVGHLRGSNDHVD